MRLGRKRFDAITRQRALPMSNARLASTNLCRYHSVLEKFRCAEMPSFRLDRCASGIHALFYGASRKKSSDTVLGSIMLTLKRSRRSCITELTLGALH